MCMWLLFPIIFNYDILYFVCIKIVCLAHFKCQIMIYWYILNLNYNISGILIFCLYFEVYLKCYTKINMKHCWIDRMNRFKSDRWLMLRRDTSLIKRLHHCKWGKMFLYTRPLNNTLRCLLSLLLQNTILPIEKRGSWYVNIIHGLELVTTFQKVVFLMIFCTGNGVGDDVYDVITELYNFDL